MDNAREAPLWRPKPLTNAIAGLILGALLGAAVIVLLEWLEASALRTAEDVERALNLSVLGAIPPTS